MWYRLNNFKALISDSDEVVLNKVREKFSLYELSGLKIVTKSLDARKKAELLFVYAVEFWVDEELELDNDLIKIVKEDEGRRSVL